MPVIPIKNLKEFQEIIKGDKPALIDFWATWCGPCRMISPAFEALSNKPEAQNLRFYKVDVDQVPDVSQECGIRAMPTFQLYIKEAKEGELVGADPKQLTALVTKAQSLC